MFVDSAAVNFDWREQAKAALSYLVGLGSRKGEQQGFSAG
jgi:hypothetical protein